MQTNIKLIKQTFTVYLKRQKILGVAIILNLPQKIFPWNTVELGPPYFVFYHSLLESGYEAQASPVHLPLSNDMNSHIRKQLYPTGKKNMYDDKEKTNKARQTQGQCCANFPPMIFI